MPEKPTYEQLVEENALLRGRVADLEREILALRADNQKLGETIAQLQQRLDDVQRSSHRQAAPFRIDEQRRTDAPKRPGRKPGHEASWRRKPDHVDEQITVPLDKCPQCGGPVHAITPVEQYIEEIPEVRVHVKHLTTYRGVCPRCGEVCSRHPCQVSDAVGAAGTHLGANALGLAAELKQQLGLTMRKTCLVLKHFGLTVTAGGLAQALQRMGRRLRPAYDGLLPAIRSSPAIYADETGWWCAGKSCFLWVFASKLHTFYWIDEGRGQRVVAALLGERVMGTLVSDCLASYDAILGKKQKCYAHHLRAIAEALEQRPDSLVLVGMQAMLKTAQQLRQDQPYLPSAPAMQMLYRWRDNLLGPTYADPVEERVANRLRKQKEHLFTFLTEPNVDATNNQAERDLRPAVIARKVSCGNKTQAGKQAWQILSSLAATCHKQTRSFADYVAQSMPLVAAVPRAP